MSNEIFIFKWTAPLSAQYTELFLYSLNLPTNIIPFFFLEKAYLHIPPLPNTNAIIKNP